MESKVKDINKNTMSNARKSRIAVVRWNDIVIGYLVKDQEGYLFKYDADGILKARQQGYDYLIGFKSLRQVYQSEQLFPVFRSRIPSRQRRDINKILKELGLQEYDEFEILLAKKGKTNTDSITIEEDLDKSRLQTLRNKKMMRRDILSRRKRSFINREEEVNEK